MDEISQLKIQLQNEQEKNKVFRGNKNYVFKSAIVLGLIFLLFKFVLGISIISGPSMEPTLYNNDIVLYNQVYFGYKKGDIVIIKSDNQFIVKRIIGVPGDEVDIDSDDWSVIINGEKLTEPYIFNSETRYQDIAFPKTVPENCYFVLGDNREVSLDSRSSQIGMVNKKNIMGIKFFVFRI